MATDKQPRGRGIFGFIVANLDTIGTTLKLILPSTFTGAVMGWATWFTGLFNQYAPASWIFAAVAGALIGATTMFLASVARERTQLVRFRNGVFNSVQINPLDSLFTAKRIKLVDLAPPVGAFIDNKTFIDCDLIGPANLVFADCTFQQNSGEVVDAIIVKPGMFPRNGFGFRGCTFQRCRFYLTTFMVSEDDFELFERTHRGLNWITEKPNEPALPLPAPAEK